MTIAVFGAALTTLWAALPLAMMRYVSASGHAVRLLPVFQILSWPFAVLAYSIILAAMALAVGNIYQQKPWTAGAVLRAASRRWRVLLGLALTVAMLCFGFLVLLAGGFAILAFAVPRASNHLAILYAGLGFAVLLGTPLSVWLGTRYGLALPVCSFEQTGIRLSLKRSVFLSQGMRWRIFLLSLIYLVVLGILGAVVIAPFAVPSRSSLNHQPLWLITYSLLTGFASRALCFPVFGIGIAVFYFDARIRKEGLDVEWSLAEAQPSSDLEAPVTPSESPALG